MSHQVLTDAWRLVQERPTQVAVFVRACLLAFVAFGVRMTQDQIVALLAVVESLLGVFQYSQTLPKTTVDLRVDEKVAHREMMGDTGTRNGLTLPRLPLVLLALALATSIACASAGGRLVLTEDAIHDSLARVDDEVRATCTGPAAELLAPLCKDARLALLPALEAGAAFNRAVASQRLTPLWQLIEAVGKLVEVVRRFPEGNTARWIEELARAIAAAYAQLKGGR